MCISSEAVILMEHVKTYNAMEIKHKNGNIIIEGPISADELAKLGFP